MGRTQEVPLILGGHTFISQLGNEPMPSANVQEDIVRDCLDNGIYWFDTTHRPERAGLGRALQALGRRKEATIIAWNFLGNPGTGPNDTLDRAAPYEPHHIDELLDQLRTDYIDCLVVHEVDMGGGLGADREVERRQEELAISWQKKGYVRQLGVWEPGREPEKKYGPNNPYRFMLCPYNVAREQNAAVFTASKRMGWETYAVSPFIRGWELNKMVEKAMKLETTDEKAARTKLADLMLRSSPTSCCACRSRIPTWTAWSLQCAASSG